MSDLFFGVIFGIFLGFVATFITLDRGISYNVMVNSTQTCEDGNSKLTKIDIGIFEVDVHCDNKSQYTFNKRTLDNGN